REEVIFQNQIRLCKSLLYISEIMVILFLYVARSRIMNKIVGRGHCSFSIQIVRQDLVLPIDEIESFFGYLFSDRSDRSDLLADIDDLIYSHRCFVLTNWENAVFDRSVFTRDD